MACRLERGTYPPILLRIPAPFAIRAPRMSSFCAEKRAPFLPRHTRLFPTIPHGVFWRDSGGVFDEKFHNPFIINKIGAIFVEIPRVDRSVGRREIRGASPPGHGWADIERLRRVT